MHTITVQNVNQALPEGLRLLKILCGGARQETRAGRVLVAPCPVMTVYLKPRQRVLFWAERDANPFFHLMEAIWMLAGRNDVEWLAQFNARMRNFSDDGETFHGAYGHRWRRAFGEDQLDKVVKLLRHAPHTRRAVIQMWHQDWDLHTGELGHKDLPCNTQIYLSIRDVVVGRVLDLTVCCRSNDVIWGAYGANAVHFSVLQEYLAARIGVRVGTMYQLSNNYHVYEDVFEKCAPLIEQADESPPLRGAGVNDPYFGRTGVVALPLVGDPETIDKDIERFMEGATEFYSNLFLAHAVVLRDVYLARKRQELSTADARVAIEERTPPGWDFGVAAIEWLGRRL